MTQLNSFIMNKPLHVDREVVASQIDGCSLTGPHNRRIHISQARRLLSHNGVHGDCRCQHDHKKLTQAGRGSQGHLNWLADPDGRQGGDAYHTRVASGEQNVSAGVMQRIDETRDMPVVCSATIPGHAGKDSVPSTETGHAGKNEPHAHKDSQANSQHPSGFKDTQCTASNHQQTVTDAGLSFEGNGQSRPPEF